MFKRVYDPVPFFMLTFGIFVLITLAFVFVG